MVHLPVPEPHAPRLGGRLLRLVHPGARSVLGTVDDLAAAWHARAEAAIGGPLPLWLALGDSLTQGVGAGSIETSFVARVADRLERAGRPHGVVNVARSGARVRDVIRTQLPVLDHLPRVPAIVTVTAGSNDLLRSTRVNKPVHDLAELVGLLPAGSIVAALPDSGSVLARRFNHHVRRLAEEGGLQVADVPGQLTSWRGRTAADGFHPNDRGYAAWVDAFAVALGLPADPVETS